MSELSTPHQIFPWTRARARSVGELLEVWALERKLPIAIAVFFDGQRIFHVGLEGSSSENDHWIEMKRRTVEATGTSSLAVRQNIIRSGISEDKCPMSDGVFAMCGGGYPLVDSSGMRGIAIVSGLPHLDDHALVQEAILSIIREDDA